MYLSRLLPVHLIALLFLAVPTFGQESEKEIDPVVAEKKEEAKVIEVALTEDGELKGNVFDADVGEKKPLKARVTLTKDGVVVDSVSADEEGLFAFASVEPGVYQMYGAGDGYFGGQAISVGSSGCSSCGLGLSSSAGYDSFASAPALGGGYGTGGGLGSRLGGLGSRLGGGGGFGGGGGGLLARGGGGLLNRRLVRLAGIGGIIAIAVGSGGADASPDN